MRVAPTLICCLAAACAGCKNATVFPSSDGTLNKPAADFAADAAARFPYPSNLQNAGPIRGLAEIGYDANVINLANYSGGTWTDVELWVNRSYVLHLATVDTSEAKLLPFKLFYDASSQHLPEQGVYVTSLELKKDGVLYAVPTQIGG